MAKDYFVVERGLRHDGSGVSIISGTGEPGDDVSSDAASVSVGSTYTDNGSGHMYSKTDPGAGRDKWQVLIYQADIDAVGLNYDAGLTSIYNTARLIQFHEILYTRLTSVNFSEDIWSLNTNPEDLDIYDAGLTSIYNTVNVIRNQSIILQLHNTGA
jgi:hypothetical protein